MKQGFPNTVPTVTRVTDTEKTVTIPKLNDLGLY
jgi:hypothetical protein